MSHTQRDQAKLLARVRRLTGQMQALERALLADAACADVLQQLASIRGALTSSPPFFRNAKDHGPSAHYRTGIPTAFFKLFILKNHFGGFLLHRRCMLYPCELGMANVSSVRRITVPT